MIKPLQLGASICLVALIVLCLAWEIFLAPLHAGGSLLFLKTLPLLGAVFGVLKGKRYTYQWSSMLILLYFTEGAVRAWSDTDLSQQLAWIEVVLSVLFFAFAITYAKITSPKALAAKANEI